MDMCRACMCTESGLLYIDAACLDNYNKLTNLNVKLDDNLPQHLCITCWNAVEFFTNFRTKCITTESSLQSIANSKNIKIEIVGSEEDDNPEIKTEQISSIKQEECLDESIFDDDDDDFSCQIKCETVEDLNHLINETKTRKSSRLVKKAKNATFSRDTKVFKETHNDNVEEDKTRKFSIPKKSTGKVIKAKKVKLPTEANKVKLDDSQLLCGLCENSYGDRSSLHDHLEKHKRGSQCSLCEDTYRDWTCLLSHRIRHVPEAQMRCHICWRSLKRDYLLEYHYKTKHSDQEFTELACRMCSYKSQTPLRMKKHISNSHSDKQHECNVCYKIFKNRTNLKSHLQIHSEKPRYTCEVCGFSCNQSGGMAEHKLRRHATEKYKCKKCKRLFGDRSQLERHSCASTVLCPICGKSFMSTRMNRHLAAHSSARPHACPQCPATYKSRPALRVHLNVHAGIRTEQCDYCPRSFYSKSVLIKHRRVHTGEKPYVCKICNKGFTGNHNLKVHMKVHGENLVVKRVRDEEEKSIKHE